jgi:hypothetical protein
MRECRRLEFHARNYLNRDGTEIELTHSDATLRGMMVTLKGSAPARLQARAGGVTAC